MPWRVANPFGIHQKNGLQYSYGAPIIFIDWEVELFDRYLLKESDISKFATHFRLLSLVPLIVVAITISIAPINVNWVGDTKKRARVLQRCMLLDFGIIMLQELYFQYHDNLSFFKKMWLGHVVFCPALSSHLGGVSTAF